MSLYGKTQKPAKRKKPLLQKLALGLALTLAAYLMLGTTLPFIRHKAVDTSFAESFSPAQVYADSAGASGGERVLCVDDNTDALAWRLRLIEAAKERVIYSTMDFRDDEAGRDVLCALAAAARRGVRVQLLVDGLSSRAFLRCENLRALLSGTGVEVKAYNPIDLSEPWKLQLRLHDKYLLVDESAYLLGGRNTNELFLGDYEGRKNADRELLIVSSGQKDSSLDSLDRYFNSVWNLSCCRAVPAPKPGCYASAYEKLEERYAALRTEKPEWFAADISKVGFAADRVTLLANPPDAENKEPRLWYQLVSLMQTGQDVVIQTPYVILSDAMYADMEFLCSGERRVRVVTNAVETGANPTGCADYLNEAGRLRAAGLAVYECVSENSCHLKSILVDDRLCLVGSFNFDMRSSYLDTELVLAVDCPALSRSLRARANDFMSLSRRVLPDGTVFYGENYQAASLPLEKKILYGLLRVFTRPVRYLL